MLDIKSLSPEEFLVLHKQVTEAYPEMAKQRLIGEIKEFFDRHPNISKISIEVEYQDSIDEQYLTPLVYLYYLEDKQWHSLREFLEEDKLNQANFDFLMYPWNTGERTDYIISRENISINLTKTDRNCSEK